MALLITQDGLEVLNFIACDTPEIPETDSHIPLTWTMIAARHGNGYVTAYNFNRHQWEIPAGGIEPGESPEDCARRELKEETSQIAGDLICKGVLKVRDRSAGEIYAAVYYTEIDTLQPFIPNEETNRLRIWYASDPDEKSTPLSRWVIGLLD